MSPPCFKWFQQMAADIDSNLKSRSTPIWTIRSRKHRNQWLRVVHSAICSHCLIFYFWLIFLLHKLDIVFISLYHQCFSRFTYILTSIFTHIPYYYLLGSLSEIIFFSCLKYSLKFVHKSFFDNKHLIFCFSENIIASFLKNIFVVCTT